MACKYLSLKETQDLAFDLLVELDSFCTLHDIDYFLVGGALIGSIRNKDLVPWDDDIDVVMKREDYDNFCQSYKDHSVYSLCTASRTEGYSHGMAKLSNTNTQFIESSTDINSYGVFLDIFPLDRVKTDNSFYLSMKRVKIQLYRYLYVYNLDAVKKPIKRIFYKIMHFLFSGRNYKTDYEYISQLLKKSKGSYLFNYWGAWGVRECVPAACFDSSVKVELRKQLFPAPVNYDFWLRKIYGDYLIPPKVIPPYHGKVISVDSDAFRK